MTVGHITQKKNTTVNNMLGIYRVRIYTVVFFVLVMFVCQLKKIKRNDKVLVKRWLPEILYWGDQILQVDYLVPAFDSLGYE